MKPIRYLSLLGFTCFSLASVSLFASEPDWTQDSASGVDASISHQGQKWYVGTDGKAYRWENNGWKIHGSRSDLLRIDAGENGAAAITDNGNLYITSNTGNWKPTGIRAQDVGIGGDKIWLAGTKNKAGQPVTLHGDFTTASKIKWSSVKGNLSYVDVDPQGRPWGVDLSGKVYVHTDENGWILDNKAPKSADIGAGGNGALYVVGQDIDSKLGGGRVFQRDPKNGQWSEMAGRLSSVTVTPDGKAFGVNSLNWMIAGNMDAAKGGNDITKDTKELETEIIGEGDKTLADIVGDKIPGANKVKLSKFRVTENSLEGWVELNGSPVHAALHAKIGETPIIGLEHASVDLASYISKIRENNLGSFGLGNAIFFVLSDEFSAVTYNAIDDVPEVLSGLLKTGKYQGLFPLELKPGVNVIGTYGPSTDGNASTVMKAFGMGENGYAVKGHFTLEQLKNPSMNWSFAENTGHSAGKIKIDKKEICNTVAKNAPISGLDLKFSIPDFKPPYASGLAEFSGASFALQEIDGKIEPSVVSGIKLNLPEAQAGIKNLELAGKLGVKGDLNVVCNGVSTQTEGTISFAGSTAFNTKTAGDMAFAALEKLDDNAPKKNTTPNDIGWKKPFGIPKLTIRSYASSGEFEQKEENGTLKRTLKSKLWANSKLDRADLDLYGSLDLKIDENNQKLDVTDWSFNAPGPIALNDLPALKDFPKVDEFVFKDIDLTPNEMIGTLDWPTQKTSGKAYLSINQKENAPDDVLLFTRFDTLKPSILTPHYPDFIKNADITPALFGFGNKATYDLKVSNAPEKLMPFFTEFLENDDEIKIANGFTLAGKVDPKKILSGKYGDLFTNYLSIGNELTLIGALEDDGAGNFNGEIRAQLNDLKLAGIPESILKFTDSELVLSNINSNKIEIESKADLKVPGKEKSFDLKGALSYLADSDTKNALEIKLSSAHQWSEPLKIPSLELSNLGFEASFEKDGSEQNKEIAIVGDGEFRGQKGRVELALSGNDLNNDSLVSFEGELKVSQLMNLPPQASSIADATFRKILISTNAVAGDLSLKLGNQEISGRGAIIRDGTNQALFIRSNQQVGLNDIVKDIPFPMDQVTLPNGVFVIGSQAVRSFDAGDIPNAIYDEIFKGLVDDDMLAKLIIEDGLMFLTKLDTQKLPSIVKTVLEKPFGIRDEVFVGGSIGGVFGGPATAGFYTVLKNVTPDYPSFVKEFIEFKDSNLNLFVRTAAAEKSVDIGVSADAFIKPRRLDDPTQVQNLNGTFTLVYNASQSGTSFLGGVKVNGDWQDPMGLEGYSLKNSSVMFGVEEKGTTIEVNSERAEFSEGGTKKAFTLDLASTWAGIVPTDLAVQMERVCDQAEVIPGQEAKACNDLILTPVTLAKLQKSIFDLALRSGSKLSDVVLSKLNGDVASKMGEFAGKISSASDGMFSLIEKSPLSFIGVKNPVIYFGTPGSIPPSNPNIDPPPLGLGLHVAGAFTLNAGGLKADLASGEYKVNLSDGYYFNGKITPPAPFAQNNLTVSGNMPILGSAQGLSVSGSLDMASLNLIPLVPFTIDGTFVMSSGSMFDRTANINADVNIGGIIDRQGDITLNDRTIKFSSDAECDDIPPLAISGEITLGAFSPQELIENIAKSFKPGIPDPVECAIDLAEKLKEMAENIGDVVTDPIGTIDNVGGEVIDALTDPAETARQAAERAKQLATLPLDTAEALTDFGINLATAGLEKVPVLGPGAGKALGDAYNKANELKNFAMDKLSNNAATEWLSSSMGVAANAIGGAMLGAANSFGDFLSGGDSSPPVWYRINPLRCKVGQHYWNPIFTQCFENGAIVLFDESSRQPNKLGDCIRYAHDAPNRKLWVDRCHGDAFNQFHLDPINNEIRTTMQSYWGYNGRWHGPARSDCLSLNNQGVVVIGACGKPTSKWTYTEDMKLQQGNTCISRGADNTLGMNLCANATKWLGTSVAPDWNEILEIPARGKITHPHSGRCLWWEQGGPYSLASCDKDNVSADDKFNMRTHARLMVLDDNHTVAINGARPWDGAVHYACMGHTNNAAGNKAVMARHCMPDNIYPESKWRVLAVINNQLDTSHSIGLKETLKNHAYVFWNTHSGQCLKGELSKAEQENPNSLSFIKETMPCLDINGNVFPQVKFRGYDADNASSWALIEAEEKKRQQWNAERERLKPNLQEWQRYRVRSENARIDDIFRTLEYTNTDFKVAQRDRKSPGQCDHGYFWNQKLKRCVKDTENKVMFFYHNEDGQQTGCLRGNASKYRVERYGKCNAAGEHDAFIEEISFVIDDKGRIVKKTNDRTAVNYVESKVTAKDDLCLGETTSFAAVNGNRRAHFSYCRDDSMTWRFAMGELVSSNNKCLREDTGFERVSVMSNAESSRRLRENTAAYNTEIRALKKDRAANGDAWYIPRAQEAVRKYHAAKAQLKADMREKRDIPYSVMVLKDCKSAPMPSGKYRWLPSIGENHSAAQNLPETARIKLAGNDNICMTGDLSLYGDIKLETCANDNTDQYFALGGTDAQNFLISSRNSKTCVADAGENAIFHRACKGNGTEMFTKFEDDQNGSFKLQNALTKKCLSNENSIIIQSDCDTAQVFTFDTIQTLDGLQFASIGELNNDRGMSQYGNELRDKSRIRATLLYMGGYLENGNKRLVKSDNDNAVMLNDTGSVTLKSIPWRPAIEGVQEAQDIPAVTVPKTDIMLLPGFDDGADRITFAHSIEILKQDGTPVRTTDPFQPVYGYWWQFVHRQQVMRVMADGTLKFDYIDESPEFRKSVTFKITPVSSGQPNQFTFESISNPGQFLRREGDALKLGANDSSAIFTLTSTAQYLALRNGTRGVRTPYKNWKYPDTETSILNRDF